MKFCFTILTIFLIGLHPVSSTAQEKIEKETITIIVADAMIEVDGIEGKILVFPSTGSGPDGPIIKFVVFGVYELPEVIIDTMVDSVVPNITTIDFKEGHRFYGWFKVPKEEIKTIWINGLSIPWRDG